MKFVLLLLILVSCLLLGSGFAQAGDVSCQVNLLKPKLNPVIIQEEASKPAKLTVAETKIRLQKSQSQDDVQLSSKQHTQQQAQQQKEEDQGTTQTNKEEVANKTAKKTSGLGGIFDILLPSNLRDSVK